MVNILNSENFEEAVLKNDKIVLVDFFATWCGPCKMMAPVLSKVSDDPKYADKLVIAKIDVDEAEEIAAEYGIMSIPNMKFFKNDEVVDEIVGYVPEDVLVSRISAVVGE